MIKYTLTSLSSKVDREYSVSSNDTELCWNGLKRIGQKLHDKMPDVKFAGENA